MRLTRKRLDLLLTAVGYYELHLIDDEMWRDHYKSERAAQTDIDAVKAWCHNQLNKRGA
jgi:hypothetical protein